MALRSCVLIVLSCVSSVFGYAAEPGATAEKSEQPREIICRCQFVELSPRAVEEFYAATDLVKERARAKRVPDFGVCRHAEASLIKVRKAERATISDFPAVLATSEKPATVMIGGEFPILIPVVEGRVAVKWQWFGRRGEVVPHWLDSGRLQLDIMAEIASRDFSHAVIANGLTVPGLTTRRAHARVEMSLGETAVVNLGPELTGPDDDDLTPTPGKADRAAAEREAKRQTVTLFLVTPTAATPATGASGAGK